MLVLLRTHVSLTPPNTVALILLPQIYLSSTDPRSRNIDRLSGLHE